MFNTSVIWRFNVTMFDVTTFRRYRRYDVRRFDVTMFDVSTFRRFDVIDSRTVTWSCLNFSWGWSIAADPSRRVLRELHRGLGERETHTYQSCRLHLKDLILRGFWIKIQGFGLIISYEKLRLLCILPSKCTNHGHERLTRGWHRFVMKKVKNTVLRPSIERRTIDQHSTKNTSSTSIWERLPYLMTT